MISARYIFLLYFKKLERRLVNDSKGQNVDEAKKVKSNIRIGIFRGIKSERNKVILKKIMFEKYINNEKNLTTKKIIEIIRKEEGDNYKTVQKWVSLRLKILEERGYIHKKENGSWSFSFKGISVTLTLLDNIQPYIPFLKEEIIEVIAIEEAKGGLYKPKKMKISEWNALKEKFRSYEFFKFLREKTNEWILDHFDLDEWDDRKFILHLVNEIELQALEKKHGIFKNYDLQSKFYLGK
jgi:hypothetical protein